jgi:uncharacterized protein RhaS with RHS repeats
LYTYVENNPINDIDPLGLMGGGAGCIPGRCGIPSSTNQTVNATRDFVRNYQDMRNANTIGADKYFHCKANCEASKRGKDGKETACKISDAREWADQNIKGDPASASEADQVANHYGRDNANSASSCSEVCAPFRPNGLSPKY